MTSDESDSRNDSLGRQPFALEAAVPSSSLLKEPEYPRDYYLKEFDTLRKEIDWMLQDSRAVERNVVIAIGVFWAFLIKECWFERYSP
jgi:hypothetical protein